VVTSDGSNLATVLFYLKLRLFESILERRLSRFLRVRTAMDELDFAVLITASEQLHSQVEMAKTLHIHPNVMTQIVRRLGESGYLERKRGSDKRRFLLTPTPAGLDLVRKVKRANVQLSRLVLHPLSDEQIRQLNEMVTTLVEGSVDLESELEGLGSRIVPNSAPQGKAAQQAP